MKTISLNVSEQAYARFKMLAGERGRPVAELLRDAMDAYLDAQRRSGPSFLDMPPHESGPQQSDWSRSEVWDELYGD